MAVSFPPPQGPHRKGDPWRDYRVWSIGLYRGTSPFTLAASGKQPILSAADITDCQASFVADPFMLRVAKRWYLYFEYLTRNRSPRCNRACQ